MNTIHLKYAVEVEKMLSITKAADNLFMAQPNLSKAIKELEDTLGIIIFERTPKGVIPTKKGAEFLVYAKKILLQIEKMESIQQSDKKNKQNFNVIYAQSGYITLGISNYISNISKIEDMDITIKKADTKEVLKSVSDGKFNLGIISFDIEQEKYFMDYIKEKKLNFEVIWEYSKKIVLSENSEFAQEQEISNGDLSKLTQIVSGQDYIPYINDSLSNLEKDKQEIVLYDELTQYKILSERTNVYMKTAPISKEILEKYQLVQIDIKSDIKKSRDVLIFSDMLKLSETDKSFIDFLFLAKNEIALGRYGI